MAATRTRNCNRMANPNLVERKCFAFGSSTPRELSYMHNVPPVLRAFDSKPKQAKNKDGETLAHYMRQARSTTRKRPSQGNRGTSHDQKRAPFGSSTPRQFAYLNAVIPSLRIYDVKMQPSVEKRSHTTPAISSRSHTVPPRSTAKRGIGSEDSGSDLAMANGTSMPDFDRNLMDHDEKLFVSGEESEHADDAPLNVLNGNCESVVGVEKIEEQLIGASPPSNVDHIDHEVILNAELQNDKHSGMNVFNEHNSIMKIDDPVYEQVKILVEEASDGEIEMSEEIKNILDDVEAVLVANKSTSVPINEINGRTLTDDLCKDISDKEEGITVCDINILEEEKAIPKETLPETDGLEPIIIADLVIEEMKESPVLKVSESLKDNFSSDRILAEDLTQISFVTRTETEDKHSPVDENNDLESMKVWYNDKLPDNCGVETSEFMEKNEFPRSQYLVECERIVDTLVVSSVPHLFVKNDEENSICQKILPQDEVSERVEYTVCEKESLETDVETLSQKLHPQVDAEYSAEKQSDFSDSQHSFQVETELAAEKANERKEEKTEEENYLLEDRVPSASQPSLGEGEDLIKEGDENLESDKGNEFAHVEGNDEYSTTAEVDEDPHTALSHEELGIVDLDEEASTMLMDTSDNELGNSKPISGNEFFEAACTPTEMKHIERVEEHTESDIEQIQEEINDESSLAPLENVISELADENEKHTNFSIEEFNETKGDEFDDKTFSKRFTEMSGTIISASDESQIPQPTYLYCSENIDRNASGMVGELEKKDDDDGEEFKVKAVGKILPETVVDEQNRTDPHTQIDSESRDEYIKASEELFSGEQEAVETEQDMQNVDSITEISSLMKDNEECSSMLVEYVIAEALKEADSVRMNLLEEINRTDNTLIKEMYDNKEQCEELCLRRELEVEENEANSFDESLNVSPSIEGAYHGSNPMTIANDNDRLHDVLVKSHDNDNRSSSTPINDYSVIVQPLHSPISENESECEKKEE